jgi:hypothetical protein
VKSLDSKGRRLFIENAGPTELSAMLLAPSYLSGLAESELLAAKRKAEQHIDPKIRQAVADTAEAHNDVQSAWTRAIDTIARASGLQRDANGWRLPDEVREAA